MISDAVLRSFSFKGSGPSVNQNRAANIIHLLFLELLKQA